LRPKLFTLATTALFLSAVATPALAHCGSCGVGDEKAGSHGDKHHEGHAGSHGKDHHEGHAGSHGKEHHGDHAGSHKAKHYRKAEHARRSGSAPHAGITKAIAVLHPTEGNQVRGWVSFEAVDMGVKVHAEVEGLTPGMHGFHIHQYGDCSAGDGTSAGGHYNPRGALHGAPFKSRDTRHVGDLGNLVANGAGKAVYDRVDRVASLQGRHTIVGRGLIVHAGNDDLRSQPTGAAGARVACGVIGVAK